MKQILTFILLVITGNFAFAQTDLYVSNNSYVFVDGTAFTSGPTVAPLFVTNRIQLSGQNSHIYLRNEAQLLQSANIGNNGRGKLSAYQTGTSNTYMYNYWASPVGNTTAGDDVNRAFIPNNNIYDYIGTGSDQITSVLANYTTGYDGVPTAAPTPQTISSYWLYTFNASTVYADWNHIGETGSVQPGYGFTMKGNSSNNQKYDFRGKPNNGNISVAVTNGQEYLVGNPYPSALDAKEYIHDTNNAALIDSATLLFWEQNPTGSTSHVLVNYRGGYSTYTISLGDVETFIPATFDSYHSDGTLNTTGGASTSGKVVRRYIPIGQGFMFKASGIGSIRTTNAMRTFQKESAENSEFFRTSNSNQNAENTYTARYNEDGLFIVPEDYKRFRLNIDFNETYTRQLLQNFHHTATPGEDYGLETLSPEALNSDVYWPQNGKSLNAQANSFNEDLRIPLVINAAQNQPIRFRIFDVQNFDANQPIFIHDIHNNIYVNLRENNFNINLAQGTYTDRFEIVFKSEEALGIEDFKDTDFVVLQNNNTSQLTVLNPNQLEVQSVSLYDVTGKRVFNELNLSIQDRYAFSTRNLSEGVYVAKITFANQTIKSKKVVISNKK